MAIALADLPYQADVAVPIARIGVLVVHERPLFRLGLRSILEQQSDCYLLAEATCFEEVLSLARQEHPDIVLLDGGLSSTDPLDLVQQLRQLGVQGIMVFAPETGDEETLFRFLMYGAAAYEDPYISSEELLMKMRRVAQGECLVTGDVLFAQAARRERLVRGGGSKDPEGDTVPRNCPLSVRELEILAQLATGRRGQQVARELGISTQAIKNHLTTVMRKLGVPDRTAAVALALHYQWIPMEPVHGGQRDRSA